MKKIFLLSAAAVTVAVVLLSATISSGSSKNSESITPKAGYTESREALYIMKIHNDEIGVFKPDSDNPLYTLENVHIKSLPQYDQSLLNTGIVIYSEKELQSLIEDYDS